MKSIEIAPSTKKQLIWILSIRGFGSEINNLLYAINYANQNNLILGVVSKYWNFKYNKGLKDYFIFTDYHEFKISLLLNIYKPYINYLTYSLRENNFSELTRQAIAVYVNKNMKSNVFKENLLTYSFNKTKKLFGIKSKFMFDVFQEVRLFNQNQRDQDPEAFNIRMNKILIKLWRFTPEISNEIDEKKKSHGLTQLKDYATFHIRRGDKVAQVSMEDRVYEVEEYMYKLQLMDPSINSIFIMTDDYNVFLEIVEKFPSFDFHSMSDPSATGHDQDTFNKISKDKKRKDGIALLTELEIGRASKIYIGSRGSNIFRLIEYFKLQGCYDISDNSEEI